MSLALVCVVSLGAAFSLAGGGGPRAIADETRSAISDSGWSVAVAAVNVPAPYDPRAQILTDQLLRGTRVPLLQAPAPSATGDSQASRGGEWRSPSSTVSGRGAKPQSEGGTKRIPDVSPIDSATSIAPSAGKPNEGPLAYVAAVPAVEEPAPTLAPEYRDEGASAEEEAEEEEIDVSSAAGSSAADPSEATGTAYREEVASARVPAPEPGTATSDEQRPGDVGEQSGTAGNAEKSDADLPEAVSDEPVQLQRSAAGDADGRGPLEPQIDNRAPDSEGARDELDEAGAVETGSVPTPSPPKKPLRPLTRTQQQLRGKLRQVLSGYYRRPLNSRDHDPWEMMHGMLAYGVYSRVLQEGPRGRPITSVGWLCYNMPCKGQTLLQVDRDGQLRAKWGVGLQGHYGQLLAMLAQSKVQSNYPIRVDRRNFTIEDLVRAEQATCYSDDELTFKLISLMYYLDSDAVWVNDKGETWNIPRLIREELAQPIRGAACGGTHRLSALSLAVKTRLARGEPLDGEYARADQYIRQYHNYAFSLQNRDGSLSTNWFRGRGDEDDLDRRIQTTGHILEWLLYSLDDEHLDDRRTLSAVTYLTNLMYNNYSYDWEIGPMSHAIHALVLYDQRVYQPHEEAEAAGRETSPRAAQASSPISH